MRSNTGYVFNPMLSNIHCNFVKWNLIQKIEKTFFPGFENRNIVPKFQMSRTDGDQ
jgi:hypothetical protein